MNGRKRYSPSGRPLTRNIRLIREGRDAGSKVPQTAGGLGLKILGRGLKAVLGAFLAILTLASISVFLVIGYLYASKSDYFAVKKVNISGLNRIGREEILKAAGLDNPVNIWLFDTDKAAASLSALSWLDEARVSKAMPDTVIIEIVEYRPKLLVSLGRLYYLSDGGRPFKALEPGENPGLVIVSGFSEDELMSRTPGVITALAEIFSLVDVLAARQDEFKLDQVAEINYDAVRGLTLFARRGELEVKVGFGAY
ncbi:MAG: FtsQ-type POTRA domain-containing protein, partial [Candidatus Adiutrix sp.]|nr:FtsQ-type POTRA domain-containing protein [Candidatus Adiutrix sp.]